MKTIFTLITSLFISMTMFASNAKPTSSLFIQSQASGDVRVIIDGRRFEPNDNSLRINGLEAGSHTVKIYQQKNNGIFNLFGKKYEVVFDRKINVKPNSNVMITVDRTGKVNISDLKTNNRNDRSFDSRNWDNNRSYDFERGGRLGDYDQNAYSGTMNDREFKRVLESINKEWLESNKLKSATQIVSTTKMTTAQVKELIWLFSFENNKLELAKRAYANTVDKRYYSQLNDVFSFNTSKEELARYIRNFH